MGPATGAVSACCPTYDQGPDSLSNDSCGECIEQGDDEEDYSDNREPCRQKALLNCCLPEATSTSLSLLSSTRPRGGFFYLLFRIRGWRVGGWVQTALLSA